MEVDRDAVGRSARALEQSASLAHRRRDRLLDQDGSLVAGVEQRHGDRHMTGRGGRHQDDVEVGVREAANVAMDRDPGVVVIGLEARVGDRRAVGERTHRPAIGRPHELLDLPAPMDPEAHGPHRDRFAAAAHGASVAAPLRLADRT